MFYTFSNKSEFNLLGVHPVLVSVVRKALEGGLVDITVICGVRSYSDQVKLVRSGKSKTLASKHIIQPDGYGHAVDVVAYPIQWKNSGRNYLLAGYLLGVGVEMGVDLRSGADWNQDFRYRSWKSWIARRKKIFNDLVHIELAEGAS